MTKIYVFHNPKDDRYHVLLEHDDKEDELSDQSWATREECEKAIQQYVKDRGGEFQRAQ